MNCCIAPMAKARPTSTTSLAIATSHGCLHRVLACRDPRQWFQCEQRFGEGYVEARQRRCAEQGFILCGVQLAAAWRNSSAIPANGDSADSPSRSRAGKPTVKAISGQTSPLPRAACNVGLYSTQGPYMSHAVRNFWTPKSHMNSIRRIRISSRPEAARLIGVKPRAQPL